MIPIIDSSRIIHGAFSKMEMRPVDRYGATSAVEHNEVEIEWPEGECTSRNGPILTTVEL